MPGTSTVPWKKYFSWQNSAPERCRKLIQWVIVPFLSLQSSVNEFSNAEVNEATQGHWNNYNKKPWNKQDNYKGKKDSDKKPWFNKDQKPCEV